jgi:hypothetical protein
MVFIQHLIQSAIRTLQPAKPGERSNEAAINRLGPERANVVSDVKLGVFRYPAHDRDMLLTRVAALYARSHQ